MYKYAITVALLERRYITRGGQLLKKEHNKILKVQVFVRFMRLLDFNESPIVMLVISEK